MKTINSILIVSISTSSMFSNSISNKIANNKAITVANTKSLELARISAKKLNDYDMYIYKTRRTKVPIYVLYAVNIKKKDRYLALEDILKIFPTSYLTSDKRIKAFPLNSFSQNIFIKNNNTNIRKKANKKFVKSKNKVYKKLKTYGQVIPTKKIKSYVKLDKYKTIKSYVKDEFQDSTIAKIDNIDENIETPKLLVIKPIVIKKNKKIKKPKKFDFPSYFKNNKSVDYYKGFTYNNINIKKEKKYFLAASLLSSAFNQNNKTSKESLNLQIGTHFNKNFDFAFNFETYFSNSFDVNTYYFNLDYKYYKYSSTPYIGLILGLDEREIPDSNNAKKSIVSTLYGLDIGYSYKLNISTDIISSLSYKKFDFKNDSSFENTDDKIKYNEKVSLSLGIKFSF